MVMENFTAWFLEGYNAFVSTLPLWTQSFINLFLLVILIVLYSIFIWKFYRFIAKRNILGLNLGQYNRSTHPFFEKLIAGSLNFIEYVLILPFLIFFWFAIFTLFLIFLTDKLEIQNLLIISATVIGAIRVTSYIPGYGEDLSKEVAKLLPFTLLAVSVLNPNFFDIGRIIGHLNQLPDFFSKIFIYLAFIVILELILRFFEFIFSLFGLEDVEKKKVVEEEE